MVNKDRSRAVRGAGAGREPVDELARAIAACRRCVEAPLKAPLPHEPRPVVRLSATARICICGQAPGTRVHASGTPFTDPSGDRLRAWMGIGPEVFYDTAKLAIVPMGFCFPGLDAKGGDRPPRAECRRLWHDQVFAAMPQLELILAVGQYAQAYHLPARKRASLTETVADWRAIRTETADAGRAVVVPLPHPSWRNNAWLRKHPWFEAELLPVLRNDIARLLEPGDRF
ncbi:uracil-DNA glycosylase family protein [Polymorphum gilvum]|uniref:Uracil DNA glycosylase superfamily n=1 Tax=Polymorphum gilvum (strain LMG 25793 / CGMCC 1.9160 / SL003B-26A1) TaxID=991905 RepID=F2J5Z4_POLGS|nr:uracil-DNA glycosylase family protein [Polymorphum gilvum]ADZ71248.1 Uracil DNA glycosylase superfamily [Polymorphum gilvum SL003B-26A1]